MCSAVCGRQAKIDSENHDYFLATFDKFPIACRDYLAPFLGEMQRALEEQQAIKMH